MCLNAHPLACCFVLVLRINVCATMCKGIALESLVCLVLCSGLYAESDKYGGTPPQP